MPVLAWRTDADGFNFSNSWTLDSAEQNTLAGLAAAAAPAAIGALVAVFPPIGAARQTYQCQACENQLWPDVSTPAAK